MECKKRCQVCFKDSSDFFINAFVVSLSPVLCGVKPIHLFSLKKSDMARGEKLSKIDYFFSNCDRISYRIFECSDESIKVIFYNNKALDGALSEHKNLNFLKSHGYPMDYSMDSYLEHLISKLKAGVDAHEMGIFFGYPLKDVMGFMGHPKLRFTKMTGWKVYGDPKKSDEVYKRHVVAREQFSDMLRLKPAELLIKEGFILKSA